jgi:hypothetical protein
VAKKMVEVAYKFEIVPDVSKSFLYEKDRCLFGISPITDGCILIFEKMDHLLLDFHIFTCILLKKYYPTAPASIRGIFVLRFFISIHSANHSQTSTS